MSEAAFTDAQRRALAALLDTLIPPGDDGGPPGAGEIGLADLVEAQVPDLHAMLRDGLAVLDAQAVERGASDFAALAAPERREALEELSAAQPAFLPGLVFHTYIHYYQDPRVVSALDLEARPPHPQGYPLEPGDLSSLERVRARQGLYREG